jgi:saccharopine dehydrogenase-like NADP-dependent oxidoreductase
MKIVVLGAGLVGLPMALDLARDGEFEVLISDIRKERLDEVHKQYGLATKQADLSDDDEVKKLAGEADIVLSAVPGHMGFHTLETLINAGKNVVDIAFFPEDLFQLNDLAVSKGVTAISDIGVAPGMSNILSAYGAKKLDKTEKIRIYVGGLPKIRRWPFEYKAVFSPIDVIEEYTRTARYVRDGKLVEMPALSEPELLDFPGIGTLEAFNSDGLRSLINTIDCPDMAEKTLRYPGHIEKMRVLREMGLFSQEPVHVKGQMIAPIDLTSKLLFPMWELGEDEDLTIMQVSVEGWKDGKRVVYRWDLLDEFDRAGGIHSMARTTGYTATATVRLLAKGLYSKKGVSAPEYLAEDEKCVLFLLEELRKRNIIYKESTTPL